MWTVERSDGDEIVSSVSAVKEEAVLGQIIFGPRDCVDTGGLDADMIRKYVRYQEEKEKQLEELQLL